MVEMPPLDELLLNFESFGDNCEFGVFQRQAGLEPLGLLRFSFAPMPSLLRALRSRFAGIAELDNIDIQVANNKELMVKIAGYDFFYHVGKHDGEIEIETVRRDEQKKLGFLIRRLTGTLTTGEKIFVRKGENTKTREQARTLLEEMREYGPATLLWVTEADYDNPPGTVRLLEPNLLRGCMHSFAPYTDAHSIDFTNWVDICENAFWIWKSEAPVGTCLPPPVRVDQAANLLYGGNRDVGIEAQSHDVATHAVPGNFPLRDPYQPTSCRHVLQATDDATVGLQVNGLKPGKPYTFSLWFRLPHGAAITRADLVAPVNVISRIRRSNIGHRDLWQRLEITTLAGGEGVISPRLLVRGEVGASFETANWRLEPGTLVGARENPASVPSAKPFIEDGTAVEQRKMEMS